MFKINYSESNNTYVESLIRSDHNDDKERHEIPFAANTAIYFMTKTQTRLNIKLKQQTNLPFIQIISLPFY